MHKESLKLATHASGTIVVVLKLLSSIYYLSDKVWYCKTMIKAFLHLVLICSSCY